MKETSNEKPFPKFGPVIFQVEVLVSLSMASEHVIAVYRNSNREMPAIHNARLSLTNCPVQIIT